MRPVLVGVAGAAIVLVGVLLHMAGGASTQTVAAPSTISTHDAVANAVATVEMADAIATAEAEYNALGTPQEQTVYQAYSDLYYGKDPTSASLSDAGRQEMAHRYLAGHTGRADAVRQMIALRTAFKAGHAQWTASHPEFVFQAQVAAITREQARQQQCVSAGELALDCDVAKLPPPLSWADQLKAARGVANP